jgi:hypothetical protein
MDEVKCRRLFEKMNEDALEVEKEIKSSRRKEVKTYNLSTF